jgi:hypothetical protein
MAERKEYVSWGMQPFQKLAEASRTGEDDGVHEFAREMGRNLRIGWTCLRHFIGDVITGIRQKPE